MKKDILGASIIYRFSGEGIKFVLIQDRFDRWTFPKGKSRIGENIEVVALREASEETGLKNLKIVSHLGKVTYIADQRKKIVHFYLVESFDRNKKLVPDLHEGIKKAVWEDYLDITRLLDYNNFASCFKKALIHLKVSF